MSKILKFEKLNSTNKYALENIKNIEANTVISAQTQEHGRGRFVRKWISDKKNNCYISFVLKPDLKYRNNFPNLTQYLSIVLCNLLKEYNTKPNIKWPNDVLINNKKICGILSEASFVNNEFNGIVLGIGVNLNLDKTDLEKIDIPATALNLETSKAINSDDFIDNLIIRFFKNYDEFLEKGFEIIRAEYISYCNFIGKKITIKNPEPQDIGIALNICNDGRLEILTDKGETKQIISGDILCS